MPDIAGYEVRDSSFGEFEAATVDYARALPHYQRLAREAEALKLRTQQQMRSELFSDWIEEPDSDIETSAVDYALDELASTPAVISDWLHEETFGQVDSLDETRLARIDASDWTAAQCLVMVMRGDQQAVRRAALRLRELFERGNGSAAQERGAEILREYMAQFDREAA